VQNSHTNSTANLVRQNLRLVKELYPGLPRQGLTALTELTRTLRLGISRGELLCIEGKWYVTHAGLLRIALRRRCVGILTLVQDRLCDPSAGRWVFKATVYKSAGSKGFVGYGDADPSNVSSLVRGAEMRVAETRAVNRALRKAYGIGLCSVEELGWPREPSGTDRANKSASSAGGNNGRQNGQPRLRDRLCLLIRKHQLDPSLVKRYAADFCGTQALRDASRDLVEAFINNLSEWATKDREGLLCKLGSYAQTEEVKS